MRILHILDHSIPLQSGYTFRTRNILREQRKMGWETCHVTGSKQLGATATEEEVDGLLFYRTTVGSVTLSKLPIINQLYVIHTLEKRIGEVIEREKPDILHAHSPALNGMAALRAGRKYGLPVVYECRAFWEDAAVDHGTSSENGVRYKLTRSLETRVFRNADAVTTICRGLRSDIIERGVPENRVTIIPNAVNTEDFKAGMAADDTLLDTLGLTGKTVLGFIGSFYGYEGIALLVDSLASMRERRPDIALLLVGGGPEEEAIKRLVAERGLGEYVVLTGRVPHHKVQDYYNLVSIFVYPRLSMRLTDLVTPLKPLEAMAQKRLVVASDVGGHKELITDRETGYLFKAGDTDSLCETVMSLLENEQDIEMLRKNGREYVERERNWPVSVSYYGPIYERLLADKTSV